MKKNEQKKQHKLLLTLTGVLMGITLWSLIAGTADAAGGRYESPAASVLPLNKVPDVLKIQGRDDNIQVYHSDKFEIKYKFYLNNAQKLGLKERAALFSQFKVLYENGVLRSVVPSPSGDNSGVGVNYEIGLPSQTGLEVNLVDGDVAVNGVVLSGLKVHGTDGNVSIQDTQILRPLSVLLSDGDVTITNSTLGGKITVGDGDVKINVPRDSIGEVETITRGDGRTTYFAKGCVVRERHLFCNKDKEKLLISIADGNVELRGN